MIYNKESIVNSIIWRGTQYTSKQYVKDIAKNMTEEDKSFLVHHWLWNMTTIEQET